MEFLFRECEESSAVGVPFMQWECPSTLHLNGRTASSALCILPQLKTQDSWHILCCPPPAVTPLSPFLSSTVTGHRSFCGPGLSPAARPLPLRVRLGPSAPRRQVIFRANPTDPTWEEPQLGLPHATGVHKTQTPGSGFRCFQNITRSLEEALAPSKMANVFHLFRFML